MRSPWLQLKLGGPEIRAEILSRFLPLARSQQPENMESAAGATRAR
jgi:hypothetical protein